MIECPRCTSTETELIPWVERTLPLDGQWPDRLHSIARCLACGKTWENPNLMEDGTPLDRATITT